MPILRKNRIKSFSIELKDLEKDEKRIEKDIIGMENLIKTEGLSSQNDLNLKVYCNLSRSLDKNKERQVYLKRKIENLTRRKFFV